MSDLSLLIVDDEPHKAPQASFAEKARRLGYTVDVATSVEDGFASYRRKKADGREYTIMLVDMKGGQADGDRKTAGWEFLQKARPSRRTA